MTTCMVALAINSASYIHTHTHLDKYINVEVFVKLETYYCWDSVYFLVC